MNRKILMSCKSSGWVGVVLALSFAANSNGQEKVLTVESPAVTQSFTYYSSDVMSAPVMLSMPMALGGYASDGFQNLHDPSVMKDLELVDTQIEEINRVRKEFSMRRSDVFKAMSVAKKDKDDQLLKKLQSEFVEMNVQQKKSLSDVLLPHQLDRMKQVSHQMTMQRMGGVSGALQHGQLAKELDMTDEQKRKLAEIQKKMNEDIAAKTKEIRSTAKQQVMAELSAEQKEKLKTLTGEAFKRNPQDWQDHVKRLKQSGGRK